MGIELGGRWSRYWLGQLRRLTQWACVLDNSINWRRERKLLTKNVGILQGVKWGEGVVFKGGHGCKLDMLDLIT